MEIKRIFSDKLFYLVFFLITSITILHYTTSTEEFHLHDIYRRAYYIPIVLAALRFGLAGGLISSVAITFVYTPHVIMRWQMEEVIYVDRITDILLFNVIGIIIGIYVNSEKKKKAQIQKLAEDLKEAYDKLNMQTEKTLHLEEKLHLNERLSILGELSASLAHEIRNPLGSLKGVSEILKKRFGSDNVGREFTVILENEINRLDSVLNNYLSLAKKGKGEQKVISIRDIINPVSDLIQSRARKQNTEISLELNDLDSIVFADPGQLQQVLLNLIINALHAIEEKGKVILRTYLWDESIVFKVEDDGRGIPEENMKRLFEPFFSTKDDGIGIGLTLSKRIIEQYDGKIECESEEGKGSILKIYFPLYNKKQR